MSVTITLKKSSVADKRPLASSLVAGELALNANSLTPGIFFLDSANNIIKVGPAAVGSTAPNTVPVGSSGNSVGEFWYDTSVSVLKIWNGSSWASTAVSGSGTVTGVAPISVNNADPANPIVSTSMATNKLLGRSTAGAGVAEEITPGTNLTLSGGTLSAPAYASTNADFYGLTTTATATSGATTITVASGSGISNGDNVSGEGIAFGTTVVSGGGTTTLGLSTAIRATLSADPLTFYPGNKLVIPNFGVKGWIAWNGLTAISGPTIFAGGVSTVTRVSGSTTATITCTNPHGLIVGNRLQAASGIATAGYFVTSVLSPTQFTLTTVATTALSNVTVTFIGLPILASGGIFSSIAAATTSDFWLNFNTPMPDTNYAFFAQDTNGLININTTGGGFGTAAIRLSGISGANSWAQILR